MTNDTGASMTHADVNGIKLRYQEHGTGEPLILLHGGFGAGEMFAPMLPELTPGRRVIAVDLQGHGGTADVDRPLRAELMGDDIAALLDHLGIEQADVMGYSLGGLVALRTAIQHPHRVRRLVLVSIAFRRDGSHPEVLEAMRQMSPEAAEPMKQSPLYETYASLAPRVEDWPVLVGKVSEALKVDYDWTADIERITAQTMLVYADADSIRPAHIVEFFALLGGGLRDAGWDNSAQPSNRLAILPGRTHYDVFMSPALVPIVVDFLNGGPR
jgi:pimeloyl-ACP methyl ester carboxylesterase